MIRNESPEYGEHQMCRGNDEEREIGGGGGRWMLC